DHTTLDARSGYLGDGAVRAVNLEIRREGFISIEQNSGGVNTTRHFARGVIFLDAKRDESARIHPGFHAGVGGAVAFAGFRFEDLAGTAVDDFATYDCLLTPAVGIINYVFIREIATQKRLINLSGRDRSNGVGRSERCSAEFFSRSMQQNGFTFALFRKQYLIDDVAGVAGNTGFDLQLQRLVFPATDLHPHADKC